MKKRMAGLIQFYKTQEEKRAHERILMRRLGQPIRTNRAKARKGKGV
jgi:hypothetical protein